MQKVSRRLVAVVIGLMLTLNVNFDNTYYGGIISIGEKVYAYPDGYEPNPFDEEAPSDVNGGAGNCYRYITFTCQSTTTSTSSTSASGSISLNPTPGGGLGYGTSGSSNTTVIRRRQCESGGSERKCINESCSGGVMTLICNR